MVAARPSIADVECALRERLLGGRSQDVREVAEAVFCGKSSLQRWLRDQGTSFTDIRRRVRVSAEAASSLGESGNSALGPLDH